MRVPAAKSCDWCGEQFWSTSPTARFCSDRHRHRYSFWKTGRRPLYPPPVLRQEIDVTGPQINLTGEPPDWSDAACQGVGVDPHPFYPVGPGDHYAAKVDAAKAICRTCPLIDQCAEWAIVNEDHGIWGGLSEQDRRNIRHERRLDVAS